MHKKQLLTVGNSGTTTTYEQVEEYYLVHILDIIHGLRGYCLERNVIVPRYAPYSKIYSNSYIFLFIFYRIYNTQLGVGPTSIDRFILNIIFKPFITRLIMMKEYLMSSENVALYGECRAFLTCIKENHGGIFR
ncbi:unnamed protein product, partial [Adineta steineri]